MNDYALRLWDESGTPILDTSTRAMRIYGHFDIPSTPSGSFPLPDLGEGEFAYFLRPSDFTLTGKEVAIFPRVTKSGASGLWQYATPPTGGTLKRIPCRVYYGAF